MTVLVVDDGLCLRAYDCRDVLGVEEAAPGAQTPPGERFLVRLGRLGPPREVRCREVLGFAPLSPQDVRPLPRALAERMEAAEAPWGIGLLARGLCLLY